MSGLTSQPSMGAVCMALEQTRLGTGIRYADIQALNLYWSQVRMLYSCFEANVRASDSSVFDHEMPGGQYTNLMVSVVSGMYLDLAADRSYSSKHHN
jgi:pyruvate carboxylase